MTPELLMPDEIARLRKLCDEVGDSTIAKLNFCTFARKAMPRLLDSYELFAAQPLATPEIKAPSDKEAAELRELFGKMKHGPLMVLPSQRERENSLLCKAVEMLREKERKWGESYLCERGDRSSDFVKRMKVREEDYRDAADLLEKLVSEEGKA